MRTNYGGCDKEVAKHLQRGQHVEVYFKRSEGSESKKTTVIAFLDTNYVSNYLERIPSTVYSVKVVRKELYVISHTKMMQKLIEYGYCVTDASGTFHKKGGISMTPSAWQYCGRPVFEAFDWEEWMLEELEVD